MLPPAENTPVQPPDYASDVLLHDAIGREAEMRAEADMLGLEDGDPCLWWEEE